MSDIVLVIVAVVTLGYLGLGVQPPDAGLGRDDQRRPGVPDHQLGARRPFPAIAVVDHRRSGSRCSATASPTCCDRDEHLAVRRRHSPSRT